MQRRAINPWSWGEKLAMVQATEVTQPGKILFCAGQVSIDEHGVVQHAGDISAQLRLAFSNLETVLGASGMSLTNVVTMTMYTTSVDALWTSDDTIWQRIAALKIALNVFGVTALTYPELMIEIVVVAVA